MTITCPFCKTEYRATAGPVECACCGCVWRAKRKRRFSFLWLMSVVCFVMALTIFAGVVYLKNNRSDDAVSAPLAVSVTHIHTVVDAYGDSHFVVSGRIRNQTADIYGVPDIIVVLRDENGGELARQKFLSPVPLLDGASSADFTHTFGQSVPAAKKVSVEFDDTDTGVIQ